MFLSVELNFRRPIYPEIHLLAKLFQNIESNGSPALPQSWRVQGAVATAILDKRDQLANSVFTYEEVKVTWDVAMPPKENPSYNVRCEPLGLVTCLLVSLISPG